MKNIYLTTTLLCLSLLINVAAFSQTISYENLRSHDGVSVKCTIDDYSFETLSFKGEEMQQIVWSAISLPNDEGMPNLPRVSRFIAVPQGADVSLVIKNVVTETIENVNIAPALRMQAESEVPEQNYIKDKQVYSSNSNYPETPFVLSEKTTLRGVDAVILSLTPFQYNPVTKQLTVYKEIDVDVVFDGGNGTYGETRYRSRWFDPVLKNAFLNFDALPQIDYSKHAGSKEEGCEYLIVIPNNEAFRPYAEILKKFRTEQGIYTKVMTLDEMGVTSAGTLKMYLREAYNTWDVPPVAVLLMGDHNADMSLGIPAETVYHPGNGTCISDNPYADVTGDLLPEMTFSRLAAEDEGQLAVLVSKIIESETQPCTEESYYHYPITALGWQTERWFQICSEAVGGYFRANGKEPVRINEIYDGTPGTIWSSNENTSMVVNYFGPAGLGYIPATPAELGGWSGGTTQDITNAINAGAFILQHRDHGYEQGWGEPDFSNSDINTLTNTGKMLFLFTINCLTGKFNNSTPCFGEAFQRYTYNGENAGAVGFIAPTEVSYSFVNDTYAWGMIDLCEPDFLPDYGPYAENSGNWMPAFGNVAGKYFLAQSSWPSYQDGKAITYQMFTAHCDAFLRLFSEVPQNIAASYSSEIMPTVTPFAITCTEGALIALTRDGEIIAVADATGEEQSIEIPGVIPGDVLHLVITKQNFFRYESDILCIPDSGPYLVNRDWIVNDENGDGVLAYNESATIDLNIDNVGAEIAEAITVIISTDDEYITFTQNESSVGTLAAGSSIVVEDAFELTVSNNVPDDHFVTCNLQLVAGNDIWQSKVTFYVYAPVVDVVNLSPEGMLVPGATLFLAANVANLGGASIFNGYGTLTSLNDLITVNSNFPLSYGDIPANDERVAFFSISLDENLLFGETIYFVVDLVGNYGVSYSEEVALEVSMCNAAITDFPWTESFESGEMHDCWTQQHVSGNTEWMFEKGGLASHPNASHTGVKNALFFNPDDDVTLLISPMLDLGNAENVSLSFWHAQINRIGNMDHLCVFYKNSSYGEWIQLVEYTDEYTEWTEESIELPEPTSTYWFAFGGYGGSGYGAVVDDVVVSADIVTCFPVQNLLATIEETDKVTLSWDAPAEGETVAYDVLRNNVLVATVAEKTYTDVNVPKGIYSYCVVAETADACNSMPECVFVDLCPEIEGLVGEYVSGEHTHLSWSFDGDATFDVYREDAILADGLTENTFIDENPPTGELTYAIYANTVYCGESLPARITVSVTGVEALTSNNIRVFPNPADNIIVIEGKNLSGFTIVNNTGQVIISHHYMSRDSIHVDVSCLKDGFYVLSVIDINGRTEKIKIIINH
ncbi:MAG: C25 family cysteine peptidase [Bacteroidales bacterium]|nr:C25 family cysteine peptidase [Bacteroidales bacterium]